MPGAAQNVTGPLPQARMDGLRAARGAGAVIENPADPLDPNNLWRRGYRFTYGPCIAGFTLDPCETEPGVPTQGLQGERWIEPFIVAVDRICGTWGWEAADYATEALRVLDANQYDLIARELWRGDQAIASGWTDPDPDPATGAPGNPYLAGDWDPDWVNLIVENGGDPFIDTMSPVEGLAALEQALTGCSVGPGLIHVTKRLATILFESSVLRADGGRLFTQLGTQVIADGAYDGSGPDSLGKPAATDVSEWAYATGPITIRVQTGPPLLTPPADAFEQAVDRVNNNIEFMAQRKASVSWGCCHIGTAIAPVSSDLDPGGGESTGDESGGVG